MAVCKWCGKEYTKNHHLEKYCSDDCRKYAYQEKTAQRVRRYRERYVGPNVSWGGVGTGNLSNHRQNDFKKEQLTVKNEMKRLGVKT